MRKLLKINLIFFAIIVTIILINFFFNSGVVCAASCEDGESEYEKQQREKFKGETPQEVHKRVSQQQEMIRNRSKEKSYFLACKDLNVKAEVWNNSNNHWDETLINFKKGTLFDASAAYSVYRTKNNNEVRWWQDINQPTELKVYSGVSSMAKVFGWVDLASGCWFKSESDISKIIPKGFFNGYTKGYDGDELFQKPLDEKFVDIMCSPHSTQFSIEGNIFTDITMKKAEEYTSFVKENCQKQAAKDEIIRQEKESEERKIQAQRQEEERIIQEKKEKLQAELKKYGVEALVSINMLEVNPYEFEGHTIAVVVQFRKMLSKNSASFYSGYSDMEEHTNVYDEIIVSEIPSGTHFESGPFSPRMMLALKGKGTIAGTNAFGAKINAPHFQWIAIISGKQQSVLEEQRDISRKNALQNMKNAYPKRDQ